MKVGPFRSIFAGKKLTKFRPYQQHPEVEFLDNIFLGKQHVLRINNLY